MKQSVGTGHEANFDVVVVGAGFAGLYALQKMRGLGLAVRCFEAADGVGGVWYWNRYPGARCDVESMNYSYSFSEALQQEWRWSERYASQPEIMEYANHVADRFDLRRDIHFGARVTSAHWNDSRRQWNIVTDTGEAVWASHCVMASGCLSLPRTPDFPGLRNFQGRWFHTGQWPHAQVDFSGQRVAVIGTGSSGIQCIPLIARQAKHMHVFQRTAPYSIPARNAPMDPEFERALKARYAQYRTEALSTPSGVVRDRQEAASVFDVPEEQRNSAFQRLWDKGGTSFTRAFGDVTANLEANAIAAEFVRKRIRATVHDPATARILASQDYPIGTKRLCLDTEYYETFNLAHVTLVDVRADPIVEVTACGIRTQGACHDFDSIVFATGYDAITGALMAIDIRGMDGQSLAQKWADGPSTYLGLMSAGFPNLYMVTGPGSPSVLSNMIVSIEQHVDFIAACVEQLHTFGMRSMEAEPQAEARWVAHVAEVAGRSLHGLANSWYLGANVPGKSRVFMPYVGGVHNYRRICQDALSDRMKGFRLR